MADEQKGISAKIIAPKELILQELILLYIERPRKPSREAWNILSPDQISKFGKPLRPSQFVEDAAQGDEEVDIGRGGQWRHLRAQVGHPTENVCITAQLIQRIQPRVVGAQIAQEIAGRSTVVAGCVGMERSAEGVDCLIEDGRQNMRRRQWTMSHSIHAEVTGRGRICCATARVY